MKGSSPLTRGKRSGGRVSARDVGLIPAHAGKTVRLDIRRDQIQAHPRSRGENMSAAIGLQQSAGSSPLTRGKRGHTACRCSFLGLIPAHAGKTSLASLCNLVLRAHPRSRGENYLSLLLTCRHLGSSPLTRGKLARWKRAPCLRGLIPAHAGKTTVCARPRSRSAAHPRSRGENVADAPEDGIRSGSSPLTRGKPPAQCPQRDQERLIPAHAGKTRVWEAGLGADPAHPRSRGENPHRNLQRHNDRGSSPLTRGKRALSEGRPQCTGLIPAHAGKTTQNHQWAGRNGAHPRSRGENMAMASSSSTMRGSSPLTRGKPSPSAPRWPPSGLIPAHAGKTRPHVLRGHPHGAHPRSRGENRGAGGGDKVGAGSSPLTRGKLRMESLTASPSGLIPAHAGKTVPCVAATCHLRAHPRSRGENLWNGGQCTEQGGSSPLTRGKRVGRAARAVFRRLIPAHAGKTLFTHRIEEHRRAHPRSRGENGVTLLPWQELVGSSPLTRGKLP